MFTRVGQRVCTNHNIAPQYHARLHTTNYPGTWYEYLGTRSRVENTRFHIYNEILGFGKRFRVKSALGVDPHKTAPAKLPTQLSPPSERATRRTPAE